MKVLLAMFMTLSFCALSTAAPARKAHRKLASVDKKCSDGSVNSPEMDDDYIIKQAGAATSCYEAANAVESCGFGSSRDVQTTQAAMDVCDKLTGKISAADQKLKKMMSDRCAKECNPQTDGTLCVSQQSFCALTVSKFINSVNSKEN